MPTSVHNALAAYEDARASARVGLSRCHTSPRYAARVAETGSLIEVREIGVYAPKPTGHTRGDVRGFSRRSRQRFLKLCSAIDRTQWTQSLLVTLTYPLSFPTERCTYKRDLDVFSKRLARTFATSSVIWKLEYQKRGAPHYHLIVFGVPFIARQWLSRVWYEVVGSGDDKHRKAGTNISRCRSTKQAIAYAAKYIAKVSEGSIDDATGRIWGVYGRAALPIHIVEWGLDRTGFIRVARAIRRLVESRPRKAHAKRRYRGRWCIGEGGAFGRLLRWIGGQFPNGTVWAVRPTV